MNTPARDCILRDGHNIALYLRALQQNNLVLISGHTHRPVFGSETLADKVLQQIQQLEEKLDPDSTPIENRSAKQRQDTFNEDTKAIIEKIAILYC